MAETYLSAIQKGAKKAGVECDVVHERSDSPYEVIIRVAEEKSCDLIMMASHGRRGVKALLIGSETTSADALQNSCAGVPLNMGKRRYVPRKTFTNPNPHHGIQTMLWFHLFGVQFDAIQSAEMAIFKIGTFISNWVASHFLSIKQG